MEGAACAFGTDTVALSGVGPPKFKLLNVSSSPLADVFEAGAPAEIVGSCVTTGGRGTDEYNERIDCLRSGLDVLEDVAADGPVLAGLDGGVVCGLKKSNPSNDSAGFEGRGAEASGLACIGADNIVWADVVDKVGSASGFPPKRSTSSLGLLLIGGGRALVGSARTGSDTSLAATSLSSSPSSVEGSGMPPSMTHLFESYLVRM